MAAGVRNHSTRVYLYPSDCHTAILYRHLLSVQAVGYRCGCMRTCTLAGLQKQHRGFRIQLNMFSNLPGHPTHKLGQGLSRFKCNFVGSPEITLRHRGKLSESRCDFISIALMVSCQVKETQGKCGNMGI